MYKKSPDRLILLCVALFAALATSLSPAFADEHEHRVAIVKSRDISEYNIALKGFSEVMDRQRVKCKAETYNLNGAAEDAKEIMEKIRAFEPDLILTIGSRATSVVSKNFDDVPIVFAMVLYPVASDFVASMQKPGKNLTGAAMDVPVERQLRTLSRIVPNLKRVGVLYSPDETQPVINNARRVAESMNITLLAEQVNSEGDVPDALNRLEKQKMDALWSVTDGKVFTRPSTRYIIEYVVRRAIPFMGPYNGFVKAGALVALTADYHDNGRQAAEISIRILNSTEPKDIAVATPREVEMALNLRIADHIGLKIPQAIIAEASQVFE